MIFIKFILLKNINKTTIKYNILLDTVLFIKQLTNFYILFYIQSILNCNILFITNIKTLKNNLKILQLLTSNPYIINNKIQGLISNWKMLQKQILLLRWMFFIINFINYKKLKFSLINIIKLFKLFIKLKHNYWDAINLILLPRYIFILSNDITPSLIKEGGMFNTKIFFITLDQKIFITKNKIFANSNIKYFKLFLELANTAYIQGKFKY